MNSLHFPNKYLDLLQIFRSSTIWNLILFLICFFNSLNKKKKASKELSRLEEKKINCVGLNCGKGNREGVLLMIITIKTGNVQLK